MDGLKAQVERIYVVRCVMNMSIINNKSHKDLPLKAVSSWWLFSHECSHFRNYIIVTKYIIFLCEIYDMSELLCYEFYKNKSLTNQVILLWPANGTVSHACFQLRAFGF